MLFNGGEKLILLKRDPPKKLLLANALLRRLDPNHELFSYYTNLSNRLQAGFQGEKRVDRHWLEITNLDKHYLLFNYECFNEFGFPHQIDTLLLTSKFLLIIDIKNISGRIDYDEDKHQLIRTNIDGSFDSFSSPFDQVIRHGQYFTRVFNQLKIPLPIECAIISSNPSTIIGNMPKHPLFFHVSGLRFYINKLVSNYDSVLSAQEMDRISKFLMANLKRQEPKVEIPIEHLRKGVLCEICNFKVQMQYRRGTWCCSKCGVRNKKAIFQALDDYRLLINDRITNQEFRDFFGVHSVYTASKVLLRLGLPTVGENRGRNYLIPENIIEGGPF
ncbi:NERD domain-containing protein [Lysinibacillus antri]|uniref:NERD domain-containing protein n=1 Tax=Lysinibacillus antri TaxID=2498145 RepID=A0A3S0RTE8_9BACI|nr:NERD domain-containing protein [Lysinibacillus antri]